jgi:hypothetical protein
VFLASSSSENQKAAQFFKPRFGKGWALPHEKYLFLLDMDRLVKQITNLISNFACKN